MLLILMLLPRINVNNVLMIQRPAAPAFECASPFLETACHFPDYYECGHTSAYGDQRGWTQMLLRGERQQDVDDGGN